ncbi:phosphonate ABC transporter ATP-binding protein [Brachybacterium sacelli]|uniref:Phosphonate transport system ATP-binding protein n=1 Tax=Brachybacterium sacelli TaxID=173364 RepID=A0ABS4WWE5_9MICO|nr:phosphonate ABC transporter ATP-binding protein [Brachybacterium sacelli]MBP2380288.1 phosphonate transport system ATP-binding protein [Brachybacterium sacelli]
MTSTSRDDDPVISLRHVTKDFGQGVKGLDDLTLDLEAGSITALLGLSGSGKSTLLRHLNGLHAPTSGTVRVLGDTLGDLSAAQLRAKRRDLGMIFQSFGLVGPMSMLENVCTGALGTLRGPRLSLLMYPKRVRHEALRHLERVGLADRAHQRADTLSGGQQQRVAIARSLMQHPRVLLADEPVASLDPVSSGQILELLRALRDQDGLTIVTALHQVELALDIADRVVGLRSGHVVFDRATTGLSPRDAARIYDTVAAPTTAELESLTDLRAPARPAAAGAPAAARA